MRQIDTKIKFHIENTEFTYVERGYVACSVTGKFDIPYIIKYMVFINKEPSSWLIDQMLQGSSMCFSACAQCDDNDAFDLSIGKKIAEARAMKDMHRAKHKLLTLVRQNALMCVRYASQHLYLNQSKKVNLLNYIDKLSKDTK